jgi:hypothetical protein
VLLLPSNTSIAKQFAERHAPRRQQPAAELARTLHLDIALRSPLLQPMSDPMEFHAISWIGKSNQTMRSAAIAEAIEQLEMDFCDEVCPNPSP